MQRYRLYYTSDAKITGGGPQAAKTWDRILACKPDCVSTATKCVDALRDFQRRVGEGVWIARRVFRASDGVEVPWRDVEDEAREALYQ